LYSPNVRRICSSIAGGSRSGCKVAAERLMPEHHPDPALLRVVGDRWEAQRAELPATA
jgi:hypothetical protein